MWHSWLARQVVALEVVGSNPTIHPMITILSDHIEFTPNIATSLYILVLTIKILLMA